MQEKKLWTRDFLIVTGVNLLITTVFYFLIVTLGDYAIQRYGVSISMAGLAVGIFIIGALTSRLVIGQMVDAIGQKKTLLIGLLAFAITNTLYFFSDSIYSLLAARFMHGLAIGVASTACGTIVAHIIPSYRKAEGIGYYSLSTTLASAIGPFMGLWMSQQFDFQWAFAFCLAITLLALLASTFLRPDSGKQADDKPFRFSIINLVELKALPVASVMFLLGLCFASVLTFLNSYSIELDLVSVAGFYFIVYSVVILFSRPIAGKILDKKGSNVIVYPCCILFALGMIAMATTHSGLTLLLAAALIGLGYGSLQSALQAVAIKVVKPHRMGLATATFYICLDAGLGFGPYILGALLSETGYRNLYWIMAGIALLCMVLFYFVHGRHVSYYRERDRLESMQNKS
ncbi:MFS transporter [Advenella sp. RU8]|uniref:MFS transporter n=1 Tax=Advenella sp. RU8 TaxID=3399575 RepID=UPI003AAA7C93